jgi:hypothetical protein
MIFLSGGKCYRGESAVEIVRALELAAADYPYRGQPVRRFLLWALADMRAQLHPRELDLRARLDDEALALNYLYLCDEYGVGELLADRQELLI